MIQETDEQEDFTRQHLINILPSAYSAKRTAADTKSSYEDYQKIIKPWLEAHPGEQLYDGETEITAALGSRAGTPTLDWRTLAEANPELALWALKMGLATFNNKAFDALETSAQFAELVDLKGYLMPGGETRTLHITKKGDKR